ncbi:MAG: DUF4347 domain-containing protein [Cyanothece sp. SIO2G6]|nr:DUF4347 domain-containing protein [Cyanothece sp. SIO2G6]
MSFCQYSGLPTDAASIVFVDAHVRNRHEFINVIQPHVAAYTLPHDVDGVDYITHTLEHYPCRGEAIAQIHLIAHGFPGGMYLGNGQLSLTTIERYLSSLREWFLDFRHQNALHSCISSLTHPFISSQPLLSQIHLYGSHVTTGDAGVEFLDKLHRYTGADVQAATTLMGHLALLPE